MSFALGFQNSTKKAWSSCNLLNRGSAKPIRNKRKNPRHMARVSALVFRIFKILPISIESQEQSSNLCQKRDNLIKTSSPPIQSNFYIKELTKIKKMARRPLFSLFRTKAPFQCILYVLFNSFSIHKSLSNGQKYSK